ncbi:hypothetical protein SAMN02910355_3340 [Terrisporobacter glycolicus]|nr:hypothetical protein SAMN02910355_3340 [Terrisporobacter glycolicus]
MKSKYISIFNEEEVKFYIMNDIFPCHMGYHDITGKKYYVFIRELTKPLFDEWCNRKH